MEKKTVSFPSDVQVNMTGEELPKVRRILANPSRAQEFLRKAKLMAQIPVNTQTPLKDFLRKAKIRCETLKTVKPGVFVHVVIGNMTCDLDSAACTIALAHLIYSELENDSDYVLPVFNILRGDLPLKTELLHYMNKFDVTAGDIIYRDDILDSLLKVGKRGQLKVNLVDHHVPLPELKEYVVSVVDHRPLECAWLPPVQITVKPVASCSSLIMKRMWGQFGLPVNLMQYPEALEMLYGAILLDTSNMSMQTMRYTPSDVKEAVSFERLRFWKKKKVSRDDYYAQLLAVRNRVDHLTALQRLYKDMKSALGVPICVLTTLVQEYCVLDDVEESFKAFCKAEKTDLIVLMGIEHVDGQVKRDIGLYSNSKGEEMIMKILAKLMECKNPKYCLEKVAEMPCEIDGFQLYEQGNLSITRKMILPLITQVVKSCLPETPQVEPQVEAQAETQEDEAQVDETVI